MTHAIGELRSTFEAALDRLVTYIETARRQGYQLYWSNYRKLYQAAARKAGRAFSELEKALARTEEGRGLVAQVKPHLDTILRVQTSTQDKAHAVETFKLIWSAESSRRPIAPRSHKIFRETHFEEEPFSCFVLMPFEPGFKAIYDVIGNAATQVGLTPKRADDIFSTNPIIEDIWQHINRARVIVAELTDRNPNVFYEVGLAHAMDKDVILISQRTEDVPFDLRHLRCIIYHGGSEGTEKLRSALLRTLRGILRGPDQKLAKQD